MNSPVRLRVLFIFMVFVMAALVLIDWAMFKGAPAPDGQRVVYPSVSANITPYKEPEIAPAAGPVIGEEIFTAPEHFIEIKPIEKVAYGPPENVPQVAERVIDEEPEPLPAAPKRIVNKEDRPRIVIVIDDIGMNLSGSRASLDLPAAVVMAILPYAPKAKEFAQQARAKGHEILVHTPMEASDPNMDLGPMALRADDPNFEGELETILSQFEGYVGINNHMGSKLTANEGAMRKVMRILKERDLAFLDSRTIHTSVAPNVAADEGVPFAVRNVFLDHEETDEFVWSALKKAERIAKEKGVAIAIGHPKDVTIKGLQDWIPTLAEKGIVLAPLSEVLIEPEKAIAQESLSPLGSQPRPY